MKILFLLFLLLIKKVSPIENKIVIDYFIYKQVGSVVGFPCNLEKSAVELIKLFNSNGISAIVKNWNTSLSMSKLFKNFHWKLGGFVDMRCLKAKDVKYLFKEASEEELFKNLNTWLLLSQSLPKALKVINDTTFSISTDFMIGILKKKKVLFYDVYNHCKYRGGQLNVSFVGDWNKSVGLNFQIVKDSISRRWNFHGMILKMAGLINYRPKDKNLADYLQDYSTKTLDTIGKFGYALWLHVSEMFNFTIEAGEFTEWKPNETNGPMITALGRRDIDLAGIPASMTQDRLNYVFPPATPWQFAACFVFRNPESKNIKVNQFLSPFSKECWYLTAMMTVLLNLLFSITLTLENIASCFERYKISLLTTYGTIFQQGSEFCPENPSGRVGFLTLGIFSLLTFNFYSAYLVSARLNEPIIKMNDSLYSLSKSDLKVASEPLIYLNFYLLRDDWETKKFYSNKWLTTPESERFLLPEEGIRKVYEGNFAYHSETDILYPYIERLFDNQRICEITTVHMVHPRLLPLYISKGSPFTEIAKIGLAKLYDMGIRHRQLKRWAAREPQCQKELLGVSSITIYETIPTLVLLNSGVFFSIIILFAEITHK